MGEDLELDPRSLRGWITIALGGAQQLRSLLGVDEMTVRMVATRAHQDHKARVLYGALDQVERAGIALTHAEEFLSADTDTDAAKRQDRVARNVTVEFDTRLQVVRRQLLELLVDLIHFCRTDSSAHFSAYVVSHAIVDQRRVLADLRDFFDIDHEATQDELQRLSQRRAELLASIPAEKTWYTRTEKAVTTFRDRLINALPAANASERLALGCSYRGGFGIASHWVHAGRHADTDAVSPRDVKHTASSIGILASHALIRVAALMGGEAGEAPQVSSVRRAYQRLNDRNRGAHPAWEADVSEGDYVAVGPSLALVLSTSVSRLGYRVCNVRPLGRSRGVRRPDNSVPCMSVELVLPADRASAIRESAAEHVRAATGNRPDPANVHAAVDRVIAEHFARLRRAGTIKVLRVEEVLLDGSLVPLTAHIGPPDSRNSESGPAERPRGAATPED